MLGQVTPFMGVWIEINYAKYCPDYWQVTPFMGVWIEIIYPRFAPTAPISHTLYGCVD